MPGGPATHRQMWGERTRVPNGYALGYEPGGRCAAMGPVAAGGSGAGLAQAAEACRGCELWQDSTLVFGEGPPDARLMLVGEHHPAAVLRRRADRDRGDAVRDALIADLRLASRVAGLEDRN